MESVVESLAALTSSGVPVYFIHGNRDFLLGEAFAERTGINLLPEQAVVDLYGQSTLIMHGDTLCTDDVDYQQLRAMLRNPTWQQQFLSLSLEQRIQEALQLREKSREATGSKQEMIMDVNPTTVSETMRQQGVQQLIHGHTHRPAIHELDVDGEAAKRIVLGDWYEQGSLLRCDQNQTTLVSLNYFSL